MILVEGNFGQQELGNLFSAPLELEQSVNGH